MCVYSIEKYGLLLSEISCFHFSLPIVSELSVSFALINCTNTYYFPKHFSSSWHFVCRREFWLVGFVNSQGPKNLRPFRLPMDPWTHLQVGLYKVSSVFCCCFQVCLVLFTVNVYGHRERGREAEKMEKERGKGRKGERGKHKQECMHAHELEDFWEGVRSQVLHALLSNHRVLSKREDSHGYRFRVYTIYIIFKIFKENDQHCWKRKFSFVQNIFSDV